MNRRAFLGKLAAVFAAPLVGAFGRRPDNPVYGIRYGELRTIALRGYWMRETQPRPVILEQEFTKVLLTASRWTNFTRSES